LREGPSSLGRKLISPNSNGPSLKNNHVLNCFAITTISCSFLYKFMTYHWKGVEKGYNFVVGSILIIICIKIYISYKVSNKFAFKAHGWPWEQSSPLKRNKFKLP